LLLPRQQDHSGSGVYLIVDPNSLSRKGSNNGVSPGRDKTFQATWLSRSLSAKQAGIAVLVAVALGIIFSILQIAADLRNERREMDSTFKQLLMAFEEPAYQAAFNLDQVLASTVVRGIFQQTAVFEARIIDNFGDRVAISSRPHRQGSLKWLADQIFGESKSYTVALNAKDKVFHAGDLSIQVDTYVIAENFLDRSGLILIFGLLRNLFLAIILAALFYYLLARPLRSVADAIKAGHDNVPVPAGHESDELGDLVKAHNILSLQRGEAEGRLRDFADAASDWFWEMGPDLRFSYQSERYYEITGFRTKDIVGKTRAELAGAAGLAAEEEKWRAHFAVQEARQSFSNFEFSFAVPDGSDRHVRISGLPVFTADGAFAGYRGTGTDITAHQRLEEQLNQAQKMEAVGQLTGGVAHDFNNLLAIIMGNLELLLARTVDDDTLTRFASRALGATQRGADLTHRLLAFSRRQPLQPVAIDINQLVTGMRDLLVRTLGETIDVELMVSGELWHCDADPGQLENAILNLSINARDAMPEGGKLTIETANARLDDTYVDNLNDITPGQYVVLAISDTGTGMSPEVITKAFEPFFTTKEVGKGSGLGLSMIYGFVKQSGGHARIYSEHGEGTTVKVYLPRSTEGTDDATENADKSVVDTSARGEVVMVVEDDADVRGVAVDILDELGYDVRQADRADAALAQMEGMGGIDLLVTDIILPGGVDGKGLADKARSLLPALKVLYMSGYSESAITHQGRLHEGVQLLVKPFSRTDLAAKVRQILDEAR
jgi:PAS domain S-box-containing protein